MLQWGDDTANVIAGGGCDYIGFQGSGALSQRLVSCENSGDLVFNSCAALTGKGLDGTYTVNIGQTVTARNMATATGSYSALYMAAGQNTVILDGNNFGANSLQMGEGVGSYGVKIEGCVNLKESNNAAGGAIAAWGVENLGPKSSFESFWMPYTPTITASGGGSMAGSTASGTYQKVGATVKYAMTGNTPGTGAQFIVASLPVPPASGIPTMGMAQQNGVLCSATAGPSGVTLVKYDGGATANVNGWFQASGEYRAAA